MAAIKVANFAFVKTEHFSLPTIGHQANGTPFPLDHITASFDLPPDARERGMLSFYFDTQKGHDLGINVAFAVSVNSVQQHNWAFGSAVAVGVQVQVSGLKKGQNNVTFTITKGGLVKLGDKPPATFGGMG